MYDLGKLWYEATGVPMVFAVFAVQSVAPEHTRDLLGAARRTLAQSLAGAKADREGFVKLAAAAYPSVIWNLPLYYESLKYDFTDVYKVGLRTFFDLMEGAGLLPAMGKISYI